MTENISDLQAQSLSRIGNHSMLLERENGFSLARRSKIAAYKEQQAALPGSRESVN